MPRRIETQQDEAADAQRCVADFDDAVDRAVAGEVVCGEGRVWLARQPASMRSASRAAMVARTSVEKIYDRRWSPAALLVTTT
jgi:hypothetical protein